MALTLQVDLTKTPVMKELRKTKSLMPFARKRLSRQMSSMVGLSLAHLALLAMLLS